MKALLIIDMQNTSFTAATPRFDADAVIQRINKLSHKFRINRDKVIFIQHDGTREDFCKPDTFEWEILSSLERVPEDVVVSKTANDSFYRTVLLDELIKSGINDIVITGCATDFCVDSTIKSALVKDFNIVVIKDGHTTADRPNLKAELVIQHYNWLWSQLTPTLGRINVLDFEDYFRNE